jgi:hypothetical protein
VKPIHRKLLWSLLLVPCSGRAQVPISLSFNSLPSAQGWTYTTSGPAESSIFTVDGTALHQNTIGTDKLGFEIYDLYTFVDPDRHFTLNASQGEDK